MSMKLADKWFSLFIRLRDCDDNGYCRCITCGRAVNWKYECDAGHFISRNKMALRYNEKNVHAQCKACNNKNWNQGEQYAHGLAIDIKYGAGTAKLLYDTRNLTAKRSKSDYKIIAEYYKYKVGEISNAKKIKV